MAPLAPGGMYTLDTLDTWGFLVYVYCIPGNFGIRGVYVYLIVFMWLSDIVYRDAGLLARWPKCLVGILDVDQGGVLVLVPAALT